MKISFLTHCLPSQDSHGAAETCYSLIKEFSENNHEVSLIIVGEEDECNLARNDKAAIRKYIRSFKIFQIPKRKSILKEILRSPFNFFVPNESILLPSVLLEKEVIEELNKNNSDAIFIYHWIAAAPAMNSNIPKLLITGDLLHMPFEKRILHRKKLGLEIVYNIKFFFTAIGAFWLGYHLRMQMIKIIKKAQAGGSFGFYDASWIKKKGYKHSKYYKTSLEDTNPNFSLSNFKFEKNKKFKIITALSNLQSTSTLSGLVFLFEEVLHRIKKSIGEENFEIHVIGKGELPKSISHFANDKNIIMRGYVENLNEEFNSADLVLIPTAVFLGFRCRILNALAQGACTIIHQNDSINQPEIKHLKNCLVGKNGKEISELVLKVFHNIELRKEIRTNARTTYLENFHPKVATPLILETLKDIVKKHEAV
jgi:glycosyltransferase involved in cell wall biosynthesis